VCLPVLKETDYDNSVRMKQCVSLFFKRLTMGVLSVLSMKQSVPVLTETDVDR
jgi:hypothetical protein